MIKLSLILVLIACATAVCPNGCNRHGFCNGDGTCTCYREYEAGVDGEEPKEILWTGKGCTERACPLGFSWTPTEKPADRKFNVPGMVYKINFKFGNAPEPAHGIAFPAPGDIAYDLTTARFGGLMACYVDFETKLYSGTAYSLGFADDEKVSFYFRFIDGLHQRTRSNYHWCKVIYKAQDLSLSAFYDLHENQEVYSLMLNSFKLPYYPNPLPVKVICLNKNYEIFTEETKLSRDEFNKTIIEKINHKEDDYFFCSLYSYEMEDYKTEPYHTNLAFLLGNSDSNIKEGGEVMFIVEAEPKNYPTHLIEFNISFPDINITNYARYMQYIVKDAELLIVQYKMNDITYPTIAYIYDIIEFNLTTGFVRFLITPAIDFNHYNSDGPYYNMITIFGGGKRGVSECSNAGTCLRQSGICQCKDGYYGKACERKYCPNNCNNHGKCIPMEFNRYEYGNPMLEEREMFCLCDYPYYGGDCSSMKCPTDDNGRPCSRNGVCDKTTGKCKCYDGYSGIGCDNKK